MIPLISSLLILVVNITTSEYLIKSRMKRLYRILFLILFTLLMLGLTRWFIPLLIGQDMPVYMITFVSWLYILVYIFIYNDSLKTILAVMGFSFSHTLFVNGLAYHIFSIYYNDYRVIGFLLFEIAFFLISTPIILYLLKNTLLKALPSYKENLQKITTLLLLMNFLLMYLSRFILNFNHIFDILLFYGVLFFMMIITYYLIYRLTQTSTNVQELTDLVYYDPLTKLNNRLALFNDFDKLDLTSKEFFLYYLDLNQLKTINDKYGHIKGDAYLIEFSKALEKTVKDKGQVYRISGDEFIVTSQTTMFNVDHMKKEINKHYFYEHPFIGVSIGLAIYPKNGRNLDELLNYADVLMYKDKENKE
ncbi:GGDEF domain-containing protein [Hujiaoplasma nucleasis]|uniref:GGDEF domain-containing protein n=1 Tax=Hujiaoplasma nucleasis TaxID=2725268 RepID=A0A7L6N0A3_9MOLU|nr:GGDEF domain-containing protein [Hujiaoplasma nucleasis]QLY39663.1 GGDEF domain-containing protein [Hujiaoplasma nucleasis]